MVHKLGNQKGDVSHIGHSPRVLLGWTESQKAVKRCAQFMMWQLSILLAYDYEEKKPWL